jgi:hypothetical protein
VLFWELVHPDDQEPLMEDREEFVLNGRLLARRVRILRRHGTDRLTHWNLAANAEEERVYLAGVDVSGRGSLVPGKRFLVGSWGWDINCDSATWSEGMSEIVGGCTCPGGSSPGRTAGRSGCGA